jgi:hypothetical protein
VAHATKLLGFRNYQDMGPDGLRMSPRRPKSRCDSSHACDASGHQAKAMMLGASRWHLVTEPRDSISGSHEEHPSLFNMFLGISWSCGALMFLTAWQHTRLFFLNTITPFIINPACASHDVSPATSLFTKCFHSFAHVERCTQRIVFLSVSKWWLRVS